MKCGFPVLTTANCPPKAFGFLLCCDKHYIHLRCVQCVPCETQKLKATLPQQVIDAATGQHALAHVLMCEEHEIIAIKENLNSETFGPEKRFNEDIGVVKEFAPLEKKRRKKNDET